MLFSRVLYSKLWTLNRVRSKDSAGYLSLSSFRSMIIQRRKQILSLSFKYLSHQCVLLIELHQRNKLFLIWMLKGQIISICFKLLVMVMFIRWKNLVLLCLLWLRWNRLLVVDCPHQKWIIYQHLEKKKFHLVRKKNQNNSNLKLFSFLMSLQWQWGTLLLDLEQQHYIKATWCHVT